MKIESTLNWISIEDAVPPLGQTVITTDCKKIGLGSVYYTTTTDVRNGNRMQWTSTHEIFKPTHWMPLPKFKDN